MPEFDIYSGLIGPLVICRAGVLNDKNEPTDVAREVFSYLNVDDESNRYGRHFPHLFVFNTPGGFVNQGFIFSCWRCLRDSYLRGLGAHAVTSRQNRYREALLCWIC